MGNCESSGSNRSAPRLIKNPCAVLGGVTSHLSSIAISGMTNHPPRSEPPQPNDPPPQENNPTGGKNPESAAPETSPAADQNAKIEGERGTPTRKTAPMRCYEHKSFEPNDLPAADRSKTPLSKGGKISQCAAGKSLSQIGLQQQQRIEGDFRGGGVGYALSLLYSAQKKLTRWGVAGRADRIALDIETFVPGGLARRPTQR